MSAVVSFTGEPGVITAGPKMQRQKIVGHSGVVLVSARSVVRMIMVVNDATTGMRQT
jgi:hypothetical protein